MKRNQKGMGAVEGLLILIIVGLIGFTGWYVYHARNNTNSIYNNADSSAASTKTPAAAGGEKTYSGNGYILKYPSNWKYVAKGTTAGGGEFASDEFLPAANYPDNNAYTLLFDHDSTTLSIDQYAKSQGPESVISGQKSTINGYDAYTENYNVPGPSGVPDGYQVFIEHNGRVVIFNYTIQQGYTETYKAIINSIKFSN